jgi:hypothetical protein
MAWYRTGTVALTNGSPTVTGTGTEWIANASIGEGLIAPDGRVYEITGIVSNTSLTISPNYLGATASGQGYAIAPLRGRIADLIAETSSLLASFATVRDGIGQGLFPNGTVSAPALRAAADQDTGVFFPAANSVAIGTGGVARLRVTPNGDVGIGIDPTGYAKFTVAGSVASSVDGGTVAAVTGNSGVMTLGVFREGGSAIVLRTNPSSGGELERMRISTNGNVGIGTVSPNALLHVSGASAGLLVGFGGADNYYDASNHIFRNSGATASLMVVNASTIRPGTDNSQNLGEASFRLGTIFAASSTINTSDEREKVWRGELDEAELRAAKRIIGELGIYQWADSFEEKGKDARLHFGVRAQRAFAILKDEGLDWWRYAWCCHDKWDEITVPVMEEVTVEKTHTVTREQTDPETGEITQIEVEETYEETEQRDTGEVRIVREAGDRYGIRSDQLAFWLIAAQAEIQSDLDARLAKLEGKRK